MYSYDVVIEGREADSFWEVLGPKVPYEEEFVQTVSASLSVFLSVGLLLRFSLCLRFCPSILLSVCVPTCVTVRLFAYPSYTF